MKKKRSAILKWLLLAVFLLAAGCFYSYSGGQTSETWNPSATSMEAESLGASETFKAEAPEEGKEAEVEEIEKLESDGQSGAEIVSETAEQAAVQKAGQSTVQRSGAGTAEQKRCYVYVCGEVNCPGVYTLPEGARIYEAIELAGGFTGEAAESWLNLAEPVCDSMKLEVPSRTQAKDPSWQAKSQAGSANNAGATGGGANGAAGKSQAALVNINTASLEELMTLKGIGASRAEDIVRYRQEAGGFTKIEDIMKVPGIKEAAFQKIKDNIIV